MPQPSGILAPATAAAAAVRRHAGTLVTDGTDRYGPEHTPLFMATLDPATRAYPVDDRRGAAFVQRAYRFIHAPRGCAAYWDQPTLAALDLLSRVSGDGRFARAVEAYLSFFMERCVAANDLFLWGNHYFWEAFQDRNVGFTGGDALTPVDPRAPATLHEMRPVVPAWEVLYRVNAPAVAREIRAAATWHLFDAQTGGFNRHTDKKAGCAFLESGGILVHALCFLYAKLPDQALLEQALRLARYSFSHRDERTDLLVNNPTQTRWDSRMATTEVGLWARTLFEAADLLERRVPPGGVERFDEPEASRDGARGLAAPGETRAAAAGAELRDLGQRALAAYLRYGYDEAAGRYYGRLNLDGSPNLEARETRYMPGAHSSVWEFLFPTHDYPLSMGMATLACVERSSAGGRDGRLFGQGARRLAQAAVGEVEARPAGQVRYAEHYGRLVVYLAEYARVSGDAAYRAIAERLAADALRELDRGSLLVGRTGANWYDAIDGVGYLLLALLFLETGEREILTSF